MSGQTRKADQLKQMVTWGKAACELAPSQIAKLDIIGIKQRIEVLETGGHALPCRVWLHLLMNVACTHLEREDIPEFVRCILPWRTSGVAEKLSVASPALSLIAIPNDVVSELVVHFVGETVFSDEMARLLKQPSPSAMLRLAEAIIHEFALADQDPSRLDGVNDIMIDPFDEVFEAMKAVRAVGSAKPTVGGRKAARDIFSPDRTQSLTDNLKCLVTSCRASAMWCSFIDNFWPNANQTDEIASQFAELEKTVCKGEATIDTMMDAANKAYLAHPSHCRQVCKAVGREVEIYNTMACNTSAA
jgi:hypothetical protein